jgi:hypothetical protein
MEKDATNRNDYAVLLLSSEWPDGAGSDQLLSAVQRTFEKLNVHLSRRLGSVGAYAILRRAVALAVADLPWLASVSVAESGSLEGFDSASEDRTLSEAVAGSVAILASVIGLLDIFVGKNLCMRMLQAVWPDVVRAEVGSGSPKDSNG